MGIAGYTFFALAFFGFPAMFMIKPETWLDLAILLLFYGVYFGVITKDIADMCTDRIASTIGKIELTIVKVNANRVFQVSLAKTACR